jgi:hypothetical protein
MIDIIQLTQTSSQFGTIQGYFEQLRSVSSDLEDLKILGISTIELRLDRLRVNDLED